VSLPCFNSSVVFLPSKDSGTKRQAQELLEPRGVRIAVALASAATLRDFQVVSLRSFTGNTEV